VDNEARQPDQPTPDSTRSDDDATSAEPASGLEAGEHEPAAPSEDVGAQEARDQIQDAFDGLEAVRPDKDLWDAATRRANEKPATAAGADEQGDAGTQPPGDAGDGPKQDQ